MPDDLHFQRAILHRPDDDAARLVYADWLEEQGDLRAEFLRQEVAWQQVAFGDPAYDETIDRLERLESQVSADWARRMRWVRRLPAGMRLDLAQVTEGQATFEVRGGAVEAMLAVEGTVLAFNWRSDMRSIGQHLVLGGNNGVTLCSRPLRKLVEGALTDAPLADQAAPLLQAFVNGLYQLTYTSAIVEEKVDTVEYPLSASGLTELLSYAPTERNLICTIMREKLDPVRIAIHRDRIRGGERPIVVTTGAFRSCCEFVIDGHHKLMAYNELQEKPPILRVARLDAPEITLAEGLRFLPAGHVGIGEYRRMKSGR